MRSFNTGDKVKIDPIAVKHSWDDLPEDLQNFFEAFGNKICEVTRVAKADDGDKEGEYIISFEDTTPESTFYGSELVLWSPTTKEWDS